MKQALLSMVVFGLVIVPFSPAKAMIFECSYGRHGNTISIEAASSSKARFRALAIVFSNGMPFGMFQAPFVRCRRPNV